MPQAILVGAITWSFSPSHEEKKVFEQTIGKLIGVSYKLVAAASQVVKGTEYYYLCEATTHGEDYIALGKVLLPLKGDPTILEIHPVEPMPSHAIQGFENWQFTVNLKYKSIFLKGLNHIVGVDYVPMAFTRQLVGAGHRYCFLCDANLVGTTDHYPVMVYIIQPFSGEPHVQKIDKI